MQNTTLVASLRKQRGWTQERLAEETGLSVRTIQRIEKGNDMSLETLGLVASALEVSIEQLFSQDDMSDKMREVSAQAQEQADQMAKRRETSRLIFSTIRMGYLVVMLILGAGLVGLENQTPVTICTLSILWVFCLIMGYKLTRYFKYTYWKEKMDKKYPLTKAFYSEAQTSSEKFYWRNSRLRPVFLIFYCLVIPLIYILFYILKGNPLF